MIREYERFSTAAMNAFVGPKTSLYLNNLQKRLTENGFRANLRVIQSNGGIATVETCSQKASGILMSGPAGGVIGGRAEGILCGRTQSDHRRYRRHLGRHQHHSRTAASRS